MKKLLIAFVNWTLIVSAPLWGGFLVWCLFIKERKANSTKEILGGKRFIFSDFNA